MLVLEPDQALLAHPDHAVLAGGLLLLGLRLHQQGRDEELPVGAGLVGGDAVVFVEITTVVQSELLLALIACNSLVDHH